MVSRIKRAFCCWECVTLLAFAPRLFPGDAPVAWAGWGVSIALGSATGHHAGGQQGQAVGAQPAGWPCWPLQSLAAANVEAFGWFMPAPKFLAWSDPDGQAAER